MNRDKSITPQRAREIWEQRTITSCIPDDAISEDERAVVNRRWEQLPGRFSWMDAFFTFLHPDVNEARVYGADDETRAWIAHRNLPKD